MPYSIYSFLSMLWPSLCYSIFKRTCMICIHLVLLTFKTIIVIGYIDVDYYHSLKIDVTRVYRFITIAFVTAQRICSN